MWSISLCIPLESYSWDLFINVLSFFFWRSVMQSCQWFVLPSWARLDCRHCSLRTYFNTHSGEKSTKCDQCAYASTKKDSLKIHSGERENLCDQCHFASPWKASLSAHFNAHSGEKSTKCDQCAYASTKKGSLKKTFRRNMKQMQAVWVCILACIQFDGNS